MSSNTMIDASQRPVERHPLKPFLPEGCRLLMLGSFPPERRRWSIEFFYHNFNNDMWRIMGLIFHGDRDRFVVAGERRFDRAAVEDFCTERGIGVRGAASGGKRFRQVSGGGDPDRYRGVVAYSACMPRCGRDGREGRRDLCCGRRVRRSGRRCGGRVRV